MGEPAGERVFYGGLTFSSTLVSTQEGPNGLSWITFHKVINAEMSIGTHMSSRAAVLLLTEAGKDCALLVDKTKVTESEVQEVVSLIQRGGRAVTRGYFSTSQLILPLVQGHLSAQQLKNARDIARDPKLNALYASFQEIIAWAYDNRADDIDFALDLTSTHSQICFKIGGRYIRPANYLIPTQTMSQLLGTAWQYGNGGGAAQFDTKNEQQCQVGLELPRVERARPQGARVRLRWSGLGNDKGTVVTLRLQRLGQSALVRSLPDAGYLPTHMDIFNRVINSEGGLVCFAGVVGSGKSTSLAQLLNMLPDHVKIQSIEDPVELEIARAYQSTVTRDLSSTTTDPAFLSKARALFRSALDVMYLGEIRDQDTGGIARQVVESGHTVYSTTHARSGLGIIERLASPQIGVPRDVMGAPDIIKLLVYQALLPVNCPQCSRSPDDHRLVHKLDGIPLENHQRYWDRVERMFGVEKNRYRILNKEGCQHCRKPGLKELNGLNGRTVVCEMVEPDEAMLGLILRGEALELQRYWRSLSNGQFDSSDLAGKTAMECAIYKATSGQIDMKEIEARFSSFETIESKRLAAQKAASRTTQRAAV